jgi:Xaa-Pro aminopeptidase
VYGDPAHPGNLAYLCGFDPRFEEAVLVLSARRRALIVGTEGIGYAQVIPIDLELVEVPTLSLLGIDRSAGSTLVEALAALGLDRDASVSVIGWKYIAADEWPQGEPPLVVPAYLVAAIRERIGPDGHIRDATATLMDPVDGQRVLNGADQLATFEWGASRASAATARLIRGVRPGMSELEAMALAGLAGEPCAYHPILTTGEGTSNGIRSPSDRVIELGDAAFATIGMWGGNCGRGGSVATATADLPARNADLIERLAIPYWRTIVAWHEGIRIGMTGDDAYRMLAEACRIEGLRATLFVAHLQDWEDCPNTPMRPGLDRPLRSGMVLAVDMFVDANGPQRMIHCEDTVALADDELRAELRDRYPDVWRRIADRRDFLVHQLGIEVSPDILPFSVIPAYLPPLWLAPDMALTAA